MRCTKLLANLSMKQPSKSCSKKKKAIKISQLNNNSHIKFKTIHLPSWSNGVLQPIHVSRFLVKAARPPILDITIVFVRVCSPSEMKYYATANLHMRWERQMTVFCTLLLHTFTITIRIDVSLQITKIGHFVTCYPGMQTGSWGLR